VVQYRSTGIESLVMLSSCWSPAGRGDPSLFFSSRIPQDPEKVGMQGQGFWAVEIPSFRPNKNKQEVQPRLLSPCCELSVLEYSTRLFRIPCPARPHLRPCRQDLAAYRVVRVFMVLVQYSYRSCVIIQ